MTYFVRRLAPFYIAALIIELIETSVLCVIERANMDFSFAAMARVAGILLLQMTISFLYMAVPLALYFALLPKNKTFGRFDRRFTFVLFTLFLIFNIFEEVSECIFWEEFESSFNFIAVDYLVYTKEVIGNIMQSYPVFEITGTIVAVSILIARPCRRFLFPNVATPSVKQRVAAVLGLLLLCMASYFAVDIKLAEKGENRYNNEVSKDGLYSLFSAFIKNELNYRDFYVTRLNRENAAFLKKDLKQKGTTFKNDADSVERKITSEAPEKKLNVIVVVMESMGYEFFDELHPDHIMTPNLSRLSKEGIFFSRTYATGTRTVRGLEAVSLSIPPLPGMSVLRRKENENLRSIGSVFKEKGYDTKWLYGGYGYFDNMNYFFGNNGFEVIDRTDLDDSQIRHANIWGVSDEDIFDRVIREADESYAEGNPFLQLVMTTSNHRPFTYPEGKIDIPSKTGRFGAVKYADFAVGELIKNAKTKPWFNDTLFVFIADHGAGSAGKQELNPETHRIPWIFYAPKHVKPKRYDFPVSQIDMLPTLLGLLNFDYDSVFYGKDALKPDYAPRYFVSNYQYVGYSKDKDLVVLKPVKAVTYYKDGKQTKEPLPDLLEGAVSYYQHASDWRDLYRNVSADNKSPK